MHVLYCLKHLSSVDLINSWIHYKHFFPKLRMICLNKYYDFSVSMQLISCSFAGKKSRELFCVILRIPILQILTPDVNCCVSFLRNWIITAACNDSQNNFSSLLTCDNDDNLSLFDTVFEVFLLLLLCYRCKLLPALSIVISQIIGDFLFMCAFVCLYVFRKFIWIFNIGNRRWRGGGGPLPLSDFKI